MTSWAWLWIVALAIVTVAGVWDDRNDRRPAWYVVFGGLSGATCVACVLAYFVDGIAQAFGRSLLPLALLASVWTAIELTADFRSLRNDRRSTDRENRVTAVIAVSIALTLLAPAIVLGVIVGWPQWQ